MTSKTWLGTAWPLIQAPMAGAQGSAMAMAVSNAGGLGSLPCAMLSADGVRQEVAAIRAATDCPYNLNFFCHTMPAADDARDQSWRAALAPYYREFGIEPGASGGATRAPFDDQVADLIEPFAPPVVSFHFGLPPAHLVQRIKRWGGKVLSSATTPDEARWLVQHGADAVIAQGLEAGGHRGMFLSEDLNTQMGTMALLPQVVRAVGVPVIAAGGIAEPAGVAAAMDLGAAAVQVGTAYLLTHESQISALHRQALRDADGADMALTNLFSGRPARGIQNRLMRELGPLSDVVPAFPLASAALAPVRAAAEKRGDSGFTPLWSGQNLGARLEVSAAELTRHLAKGFEAPHADQEGSSSGVSRWAW